MARGPSNPEAFMEATAAANGDRVEPIKGAQVAPDMMLWHEGEWLIVRYRSSVGNALRLDFQTDEPGATAMRFTSPGAELYRRISTPQAAAAGANSTETDDGTAPRQ